MTPANRPLRREHLGIQAQTTFTVERPIDDVFVFISNLENSPAWGRTIKTTKVSAGPLAVGTRFHEDDKILGRVMELNTEITGYDPPTGFSFRALMGKGQEARAKVTFTTVEEGTEVNFAVEGEMGGLADLFAPIMSWVFTRQQRPLFKKLKEVLEAQDPTAA